MLGLIWAEQKRVEKCVSLYPAGSWNQLRLTDAWSVASIPSCLSSYHPANQGVQQLVHPDLTCSSLKTLKWVLCACRNIQTCTLFCRCFGSAFLNMLLQEKLTMACAVVLLLLLSSLRTALVECGLFCSTIVTKPLVCKFKILAYFFCSFSCPRNKIKTKKKRKVQRCKNGEVRKVERLNEKKWGKERGEENKTKKCNFSHQV